MLQAGANSTQYFPIMASILTKKKTNFDNHLFPYHTIQIACVLYMGRKR